MAVYARPRRALRPLLADTRGANLVESIAALGLVAILAIAGFELFGGALRGQADLAAVTTPAPATTGTAKPSWSSIVKK